VLCLYCLWGSGCCCAAVVVAGSGCQVSWSHALVPQVGLAPGAGGEGYLACCYHLLSFGGGGQADGDRVLVESWCHREWLQIRLVMARRQGLGGEWRPTTAWCMVAGACGCSIVYVLSFKEVFLVDCVIVVGYLGWRVCMLLEFGWSGEGFCVVGEVCKGLSIISSVSKNLDLLMILCVKKVSECVGK